MTHLTRRDLCRNMMMAGVTLPLLRAFPAMAAPSMDRAAILATVTPELRPAAAKMLDMALPPLTDERLVIGRKMPMAPPGATLKVSVEEKLIPGGKGQPDVKIYILNRKAGGRGPGLLHTHGGGYVLGSAKAALTELQSLCIGLDCPAVSVEYRLAPETRYSESIEDNYAGLKWLHAHAGELGVDPAKIVLVGESAGGGHAALLAITARDRGEVPVAFQCLIYPMLDDRTGTSRAVPSHIGQLIWTAENNRFGWKSFLGVEPGGTSAPANAVPARVENLKGLPPAFIGVGSIDLFVDEDVDYAQRLVNAGVDTELLVLPGAFHGFDSIAPQTSISRDFNAEKIKAIRRGLGLAAAA